MRSKPDELLFYWKLSSIARACGINLKTMQKRIREGRVAIPRDGRRYRFPKSQIPDLIQRMKRPK